MKRIFGVFLIFLLLVPSCGIAELRRGDKGEEVAALQQLLFETGFIFEEPDGAFGKNTEKAVKWFQKYAGLKQTGVADDNTLDSLYACWLRLMEENGTAVPLPEDELESQTAGFISGYNADGDAPVCCQRYTTDAGDEHIELCSRHIEVAQNDTLGGVEKWTNALNALYDEWLAASAEEDRAAVASSQAFFTLWLDQQRTALERQNAADADSRMEMLLRNQCADLCQSVYALTGK